MSLTTAQLRAIAVRGNALVIAGAGTGKTRTLVERCLDCLVREQPAVGLDEILMVTFTEAAAAEMRERIRHRLEKEAAERPDEIRWQEQLELFETASIGTLHSFCLRLAREHFYELELDPQLTVLADEEAHLLAAETLADLFQRHYSKKGKEAEEPLALISAQRGGSDKPLAALILKLHNYAQTTPDPGMWFKRQFAAFDSDQPIVWRCWLKEAMLKFRDEWLAPLQGMQNPIAQAIHLALSVLKADFSTQDARELFKKIDAAREACPAGKKKAYVESLKEFNKDSDFLESLFGDGKKKSENSVSRQPDFLGSLFDEDKNGPLAEDWRWIRSQTKTLLLMAQEFEAEFSAAKKELGVADFHDLEQYALRLLWDSAAEKPTKIAQQWRNKLRFIFVDEYQDINAAQDKIIEALSGEGKLANRFLVGDVKQSIYRFRQSNPRIFLDYAKRWPNEGGTIIPLIDNFRSREGVLDFVNAFFSQIMREDMGGIAYDEAARLQFGDAATRKLLSVGSSSGPCVELHVRMKEKSSAEPENDVAANLLALSDMEESEKEARLVALRLRELKRQRHKIWDEKLNNFRQVEWRDMAILLRARTGKAQSYAKEFSKLDIPLQVARGGFYESVEISDLRCLLQILDNPLQDIPVVAVLHSPLVGLSVSELTEIRLASKGSFWLALRKWKDDMTSVPAAESASGMCGQDADAEKRTLNKVGTFLERFSRWRRLARQGSLSQCLEAILSETHYRIWLLTQSRGEERQANVQRFLSLAQQFDQFQRQGLYRFLKFIEAQQEAETEPEVAPVSEDNSIQLMTIHQSKGLEFPIVVLADLGKLFNTNDQRADIILDEVYGLCPRIKPLHIGKSYPSLPYWLARRRQHQEMLAEELRILYVGMTRARDLLILSASVQKGKFEKAWLNGDGLSLAGKPSIRSVADWLGAWISQLPDGIEPETENGANNLFRWTVHNDASLAEAKSPSEEGAAVDGSSKISDGRAWLALENRLAWKYRFGAATTRPAKTSVSILRKREILEADDSASRFQDSFGRILRLSKTGAGEVDGASAADVGSAHHAFLQYVALDQVGDVSKLRDEAARLVRENFLTEEQMALLDFQRLADFWKSDLGKRVQARPELVKRELAFTARFSAVELDVLAGLPPDPGLEDEFVVVQGVADLVVFSDRDLWLIDFKTDAVVSTKPGDKLKIYEPQLRLYAKALGRIYNRPVSECWLYFLASGSAMQVSD